MARSMSFRAKIVQAAFLDVEGAFDKVYHLGLLEKLQQINISDTALTFFRNYLSERRIVTVIEGTTSDEAVLHSGVPQGSSLGPLLFILYINDIASGVTSIPYVYADDTTLLAIGESTHETSAMLNKDLNTISFWASKWKTKFNPSKSTNMIFSKSVLNNSEPVYMDGILLDRVSCHKHLGVFLTSDLNWEFHVKEIIRKANYKLSYMWSVKGLSRQTLDTLYKLHIRSIIDYCFQVFGPGLTTEQIKKLDQLQYRAAIIVTGALKSSSREKLLADLGWETNLARLEYLSICHFQKIYTFQTRNLIRELLPPLLDPKHQRNRKFQRYMAESGDFKKSFFPFVIEKWEKLDTKIKILSDMTEFKRNLSNIYKPEKVKHYKVGTKIKNSMHTQLRVGRTYLNHHLFEIGLSPTPKCLCGAPQEDTEHFLMSCFLFSDQRKTLFGKLDNILAKKTDKYSKKFLFETLLYGIEINNIDYFFLNKQISYCVQTFLFQTRRLLRESPFQLKI